MPTNTTIAAASERYTARITKLGRSLIVTGSPNNVLHRASHWSAADFGASNSVEQAYTRAELGYVSPGRVTKSLGNSSPRFHESAFESATVFASESGKIGRASCR